MKKKYSVRIYLHTFVDMEVEAENKKEAQEIASYTDEYDMEQVMANMVPCNEGIEDIEVVEL